ncbi:hypothetical protein GJ744_005672 [Endocarpon pusillum]|uniref:Uncharacterized protein n=1 Tax=Endocarpon pusillum TaxID=364733 RepID=A0A8H7A6X4_9EURO|nr:hypothetical protein GJ744_005672 [Endocarpon pusillum]
MTQSKISKQRRSRNDPNLYPQQAPKRKFGTDVTESAVNSVSDAILGGSRTRYVCKATVTNKFDFQITYRPGAQNLKADLLTRQQKENEVFRAKLDPHLNQSLLKLENLSDEVKQDIAVEALDEDETPEEDLRSLVEIVEEANRKSPQFDIIRGAREEDRTEKVQEYNLDDYTELDGLLFCQNKLAIS